jgi:hypothetical protein
MHRVAAWSSFLTASALVAAAAHAAPTDAPSRPPIKDCKWERLADATVGLAAWVERCDFGFRKIDFLFVGRTLALRYSDGGAPDPLIDVIDRLPGESPEAAVKRHFASHTDKALAARCVMVPYRGAKTPPGTKLYSFVPDPAYGKKLKAKADPNEVGDPPCGDWGDAPDGIRYYEVFPASRVPKVLFVRVGQDKPLFDEKTLRLIELK